jgi:anti-sigma factor RsiW
MDDRVEAYVDGDLSADERARFEGILDEQPHWQAQVSHAKRIRDALHRMPQPTCPPQVTDAVMSRARRRSNGQATTAEHWWNWIWRELDIEMQTGWKPALAFATLLMIIVTSSLLTDPQSTAGLLDQPTVSQQYSPTEIQRAESQAKWAIAYIAQVGQTTGSTMERAIFEEHMAAPIRRALRPLSDSNGPTQPSNR